MADLLGWVTVANSHHLLRGTLPEFPSSESPEILLQAPASEVP